MIGVLEALQRQLQMCLACILWCITTQEGEKGKEGNVCVCVGGGVWVRAGIHACMHACASACAGTNAWAPRSFSHSFYLSHRVHKYFSVRAGAWQTAWERRSDLLEFIRSAGGLGTMLNYRRLGDYDDNNLVERYLNDKGVQVGDV